MMTPDALDRVNLTTAVFRIALYISQLATLLTTHTTHSHPDTAKTRL